MIATEQSLMQILHRVQDPEIPVVDVVEMGIVRDAQQRSDGTVTVVITPTYSGCPAMQAIEDDIVATLKQAGHDKVEVQTRFAPAWTTDWMTEEARTKLKNYGIAPPQKGGCVVGSMAFLKDNDTPLACPYCDAKDTDLRSQFGSTACKALYYCNVCHQPFEYFKCI